MSDGSNLGIDADRALQTILGGAVQPGENEVQTRDQVLGRLEHARPTSYSGSTDCLTRDLHRMFRDRPETMALADPELSEAFRIMASEDGREAYSGCTGFMWGFAVNQARWLMEAPEIANPAIIEVRVRAEDE